MDQNFKDCLIDLILLFIIVLVPEEKNKVSQDGTRYEQLPNL